MVPADHRQAMRAKANQLWHTDCSFKSVPALTSVLSARIIPANGGETEYVSTRLAFERLDADMQERLENLFAWHDYAHSRSQIAADLASPEERAALPPQCWRMVWTNPVNGRGAVYLASHAFAVEGMEALDGRRLITELMEAATEPGNSYLHPWRKGDVVMWDNRATMHRGRPWPAHEARLMVRTTISAHRRRRRRHHADAIVAGRGIASRPHASTDAGGVMARIEARLAALGLVLPPAFAPPPGVVLPFVNVRLIGNRGIISGHGPQHSDGLLAQPLGKVGRELTLEQGYAAAKLTALSMLGSLQRAIGDLDRVAQWVRIFGMVNSAPGFVRQPAVINGFSDLILELWGTEAGAHARSAVGMAELPFGMPVEIEGEVVVA